MTMNVLVISRDTRSLEFLTLAVRQGDFLPLPTRTISDALSIHEKTPARLVVLESTASLSDLISMCQELKRHLVVPVIVITPWTDEMSLLRLYEAGADDCLTWPYSPRILEAKIRVYGRLSSGFPASTLSQVESGNMSVDPEHHTFTTASGSMIRLTPLEFRLLYVLILNQGRVLATETLVDKVWGYTGEGSRDLLKGLIRRLRGKIEADPHRPKLILTVAGVGYSFSLNDEP